MAEPDRPQSPFAGMADFSVRTPVRALSPDEIERMAGAWNEVLDRLETSIKRIRRFTSDASHELRTPLALIRATAELALRRDREPACHHPAEAGPDRAGGVLRYCGGTGARLCAEVRGWKAARLFGLPPDAGESAAGRRIHLSPTVRPFRRGRGGGGKGRARLHREADRPDHGAGTAHGVGDRSGGGASPPNGWTRRCKCAQRATQPV